MNGSSDRGYTNDSTTANVGLHLSGDFGSPLEVAAADSLTIDQKLEILRSWRDDLERRDVDEERSALMGQVQKAIAGLEAERDRD